MDMIATLTGLKTLVLKRYLGPFWGRRAWLAKTQWMGSQELEHLQIERLSALLEHCRRSVPYYREWMSRSRAGPGAIHGIGDIQRLPILTKQDVVKAGSEMVCEGLRRYLSRTAYTGGTTGTTMHLRRDLFSIGNEHAFVRRQWDWAGVGLSDRCAYLTGRLIADTNRTDQRLWVYDPVMKELILSTYHLSTQTAIQYAEVIRNHRVKAIVGYPSSVHLLAVACLDHRFELPVPSVLTSSETLTASMKDTISQAFGCKVFDFYGSAERVCYIHTCEQGRYHVIPEYGLTELVPIDPAEPNRCRVVSTGFWNLAMPLIRYDLGDIVIKSPEVCPCGRAFPVVSSIEGRQGDVIRTPSGRQFGAAILTHILYGTNHIAESQIVQDSLDHVTIIYVPSSHFSQDDLGAFESLIRQHLPAELRADTRKVESIARTSSGKIRPVVSLIPKESGGRC